MSREAKLFLIVGSFVALAASSIACDRSTEPAPEPVPTAAQEKQKQMEDAEYYNQAIFQNDREGYAICEGTKGLASMKEAGRAYRFELSSQESANLSLCTRNEAGNYSSCADISGVNAGDYLYWDDSGVLHWTHYHE